MADEQPPARRSSSVGEQKTGKGKRKQGKKEEKPGRGAKKLSSERQRRHRKH